MAEGLDVKGKRVLVVGLGKSGVSSALFLQGLGARVTVSDTKTEEQLKQEIPALLDKGITVEAGHHGERTFRGQEVIVVSPGVPFNEPHIAQARVQGTPVIGEIELASRFLKGRIIAITGSNGKTTSTALTGEVIAAGGFETLVGGNIGTPAITLVPQSTESGWVVLEISSFQLESIETFRPNVAVVINVTPDHLDRHGNFEGYAAAKARIFENQTEDDYAVLNADDATCVEYASNIRSQVRWFSTKDEVGVGAFIRDGKVVYRDDEGEREVMQVSEIQLKGAHNHENVLASVCCGMIADVKAASIRQAVKEFKAVEHRLEYVATVDGVQYFNDSKATNVDATIKALESFPSNVHIILGGKDKGSDYTVLKPLLKERAKRVYTIGAAAEKIENHLESVVDVVRAGTLEKAVKQATEAAKPGDVVLLAPACASFDQFQSYEHRGKAFKDLVHSLEAKHAMSKG
jgi:UDP-N-acetylmuramoylalanine--D-glutamate ligase